MALGYNRVIEDSQNWHAALQPGLFTELTTGDMLTKQTCPINEVFGSLPSLAFSSLQ